jgi:hypothetical protein
MRATLRLAFTVGVLITLFPPGVGAEQVNNWRDGANYPSRITAIPIGGNKLTLNHSVRIGAWTVSFTGGPVIAHYGATVTGNFISTYTGESDQYMGIICSNPLIGNVACAFIANFNGSPLTCTFHIYSRTENALNLDFPCPSYLGLN